jgi:hypothetical protein
LTSAQSTLFPSDFIQSKEVVHRIDGIRSARVYDHRGAPRRSTIASVNTRQTLVADDEQAALLGQSIGSQSGVAIGRCAAPGHACGEYRLPPH